MKNIKRIEDIPTSTSFCAVRGTTIYTPGDQRSRDYPGHGYPESWDPAIEMISFVDQNALEVWAGKNHKELEKYKLFKMTPITVEQTVSLKIAATY
jgi:hypothetical protein